MKKILGVIALSLLSMAAQAKNFAVTSLVITEAQISAPFIMTPTKTLILNVSSDANLAEDYAEFTSTLIGPPGEQILYTAESNTSPLGMPIPAGIIAGGPVPSGTVDMSKQTITVDMSSVFAAHGPMDQNIGGQAVGVYTPGSGEFSMSWGAVLTQGPAAGLPIMVTVSGVAEVKHIKKAK